MHVEHAAIAYRNPDPRYHADFPAATVTREGDVVMIARKCGQWAHDATFKFRRPLTFFETRAEIVVLRSTDGGSTFVAEASLYTGLAYDPTIVALADGRLMAGAVLGESGSRTNRSSLRGVLHRHLPQLDTVITVRGVGLWFSEDGGRTWLPEPRLVALPGWENVYNLRRPIELADGVMLMPVTTGFPWRSRFVGALRSWDGGETWGDPSIVAEDPAGRAYFGAGLGYWQPAIAVMASGELVCMCVLDESGMQLPGRIAEAQDLLKPGTTLPSLYVTRSRDSGLSWCALLDAGLEGDFPALTALPSGDLLLTCTQRRADRSAVIAHVSADGIAWGEPIVIREATDHLFYYPSTVQLPDAALLTTCMASPHDQVRFVEAVRWRR